MCAAVHAVAVVAPSQEESGNGNGRISPMVFCGARSREAKTEDEKTNYYRSKRQDKEGVLNGSNKKFDEVETLRGVVKKARATVDDVEMYEPSSEWCLHEKYESAFDIEGLGYAME